MSLINLDNNILFVGLIAAIILLIFPKLNYIIKAILTVLITILLGYISINLFALNISSYTNNDPHGIIILIAFIYEGVVSIFSGLIVIAIFIFKNEKMSKIIAKIFNNN
jgi:hypothetical protein